MAKDLYHEALRIALEKDGWTITHDPLPIKDKSRNIDYDIDLGAEKLLVAEKGIEKITIENKSFLKASLTNEFHGIFGQYLSYFEALQLLEYDYTLYLAVPKFAHERLQDYPFLRHLIEKYQIKTVIYDENLQNIIAWEM